MIDESVINKLYYYTSTKTKAAYPKINGMELVILYDNDTNLILYYHTIINISIILFPTFLTFNIIILLKLISL